MEAIAYGWIDDHKKPFDDDSYLHKKNCDHAERLIEEGRITAAGQLHIDATKAGGRWENVYSDSSGMEIPKDFLTALESNLAAKAVFATMDRKELYTISRFDS